MNKRMSLRPANPHRSDREGAPAFPAAGEGGREARAEMFLCLGRAFSSPVQESAYEGFARYLADDLAAIAAQAGYSLDGEVEAFRESMALIPGPADLLRLYSGLFLSPPAKVDINAGMYLDGGILGPSELEMERRYARHGLRRAEGFHDLSDHLSPMLEFLALLWGKAERGEAEIEEAIAWCEDFLKSWLSRFLARIADSCATENWPEVYLHLARIVEVAVEHDVALARKIGARAG